MEKLQSLGIRCLESIHYYVHDLERSRRFYTGLMDFQEVGESSPELTARGKQKSVVFRAGDCNVICSAPIATPPGETGGRAARFLKKHPDGVGTLAFEVDDIETTFKLLEGRDGTIIEDIATYDDGKGGTLRTFSITTPFGDTTFRFAERKGYAPLFPGLVLHPGHVGGHNKFKIRNFDHVTTNFQTMKPALLWMEHVCGFEKFWEVKFHTDDVAKSESHGSGVRSQVMWDPKSGVRFANNEPWRPFFKRSQINIFNEDHRGDGVQHVAIEVDDIITAVRDMRAAGIAFMPTPGSYYDQMPERLVKIGVQEIEEPVETLRELQILVDGGQAKSYMLQIFLRDSAGLYAEPAAGPFFYEIIQRKGDKGFGFGNFRALFESIERDQTGVKAPGDAKTQEKASEKAQAKALP